MPAFDKQLVLNQWVLQLIGVKDFETLAAPLRDPDLEGVNSEGVHRFYEVIKSNFVNRPNLDDEALLAYDEHIVRHTDALNGSRTKEPAIRWKYFQYLILLFTEIYLDRYFTDRQKLCSDLNGHVDSFNASLDNANDHVAHYALSDLNKLAIWAATGSGKTFMMHVNRAQYLEYATAAGSSHTPDKVILVTPNEGLSRQHLAEFTDNGIQAALFDKNALSLFSGHSVEIIDINKLKHQGESVTTAGGVSVPVESFEGRNLVLVDEGHRGAAGGAGGAWMKRRDALCADGFSFEYSATLGQAVAGNPDLRSRYCRAILFDYSYKYFHRDGFGKDFRILNVDEIIEGNSLDPYLVGCLMMFVEQRAIFSRTGPALAKFNIASPLLVFVGGSVAAPSARERTDVVEILSFFSRFVSDAPSSVATIASVLEDGLPSSNGDDVFDGAFRTFRELGWDASAIFTQALELVFNANAPAPLHVTNLRGVDGEVALSVGGGEPFGVVNVGDDTRLVKACDEADVGLVVSDNAFSESLFGNLNRPTSKVNVLVGAKKFTEGWSSFRVSSMGLMRVGQNEGPQIIQLFGRGVRLNGYDYSLKRSSAIETLKADEIPAGLRTLETLNVFGIRANYMAQFRGFLEEDDVKPDTDRPVIKLPVHRQTEGGNLRIIRLKKTVAGTQTAFGEAFRRKGPIPTLCHPGDLTDAKLSDYMSAARVVLDWYPKVEAVSSGGVKSSGESKIERNSAALMPQQVAMLNEEQIYLALERYKRDQGWYNFNVSRSSIRDLLATPDWYELFAPDQVMGLSRYENVAAWEAIAIALLRKYMERFYKACRKAWEMPHLELRTIEADDPNLLGAAESREDDYFYRVTITTDDTDLEKRILGRLEDLRDEVKSGSVGSSDKEGICAIGFDAHLYEPLLALTAGNTAVDITPTVLNGGEATFITDLRKAVASDPPFLDGKELFVLRNLSKGKGVGFFDAGMFYPDFILWLIDGEKQKIIFVDPKGLRQIEASHPKIGFFKEIKEVEARLGDENTELHSFIVSVTDSAEMTQLWDGMSKAEMADKNIVFQKEDSASYIEQILTC